MNSPQASRFPTQDLAPWPGPDFGPVRAHLLAVPLVTKRVIVRPPPQPTSSVAEGRLSRLDLSLPSQTISWQPSTPHHIPLCR